MNEASPFNRRILVIDDNPSIHEDFHKLLAHDAGGSTIDQEAADLFGYTLPEISRVHFEFDSAFQGEDGLRKVEIALAAGVPYAMAFVDMRMPPGWDGLETIRRLWQVAPDLEVVICTAYSDRSWDEIHETLGISDRLLILKKPFDKVEVGQLALALTEKWNLRQLTRHQTESLEESVRQRTSELCQEQKNLRLIQAMTAAANEAPNTTEAIRTALRQLCSHLGWPVGHAYLLTRDNNTALTSLGLWHHDEIAITAEFRALSEALQVTPGVDLPGHVMTLGAAVSFQDLAQQQHFRRHAATSEAGFQAGMAFPLLVGTRVVGVLEFFTREARDVEAHTLQIMNHIGAQLGRVVERQWAREALQNSEAYFRSLTDNALDLITLVRPDGAIHYESCSVEKLLGYQRNTFRGRNFFEFIHAEDAAVVKDAFQWIQAHGGDTPQLTFRFRHQDGSHRLLEGMGKNLLDDPLVGAIILNARDITERKGLEAQLLQSQKVQAIGQLAGGVAHDFNNVLTAIIGYTDLLLKKLPRHDGLHLNAEEIKKAAGRAASLTRQLLAFSRKQVLQPRVLDLNGVVTEMDKMLRRLVGENIELITIARPDLGRVKADGGQLEQVLVNLAVNARDAMCRQGKMIIETANVTLGPEYCRQRPEVTPGEYVMMAISDNGSGMTPEVKARIFEPFFTTKEVGKGTGLGLATCHGIVKQSAGHIAVYSEIGRGTTFKIYLPRVYEQMETVCKRERPPSELSSGTETVLLVEDEPMLRELGLLVLSGLGYRVLPADNGVQALRVLEQHRGQEIHLLVTDVVMPEMGGKELSEQFRIVSPRTKVLFCSGYTEDAVFHDGSLAHNVAFLQKPYTIATLASKVRAVLEAA